MVGAQPVIQHNLSGHLFKKMESVTKILLSLADYTSLEPDECVKLAENVFNKTCWHREVDNLFYSKTCNGETDVLGQVLGCGPFQCLMYSLVYALGRISVAYPMVSMAFGSYNPGWRCLDNSTDAVRNLTMEGNDNKSQYTHGSCDAYKECQRIEFDPSTLTVVSEWGLICDKAWVITLIIVIQNVGMVVGAFVGGQLSDSYGRKVTFYGAITTSLFLQIITAFSVSWKMFVIVTFFSGISYAVIISLTFVYTIETMSMKWRAVAMNVPLWNVGSTINAFVCMALRDWRKVELVGSSLFMLAFLPVFWTPESLRWLGVNSKPRQLMKVATKITKLNKKAIPSLYEYDETPQDDKTRGVKYSVLDLFRSGYRMITFLNFVMHFCFGMLFNALMFGVKALYGDFYVNLVALSLLVIPFPILGTFGTRFLQRRILTTSLLICVCICALGAIGCLLSDSQIAKTTISTVLISFSKGALGGSWSSMYPRVSEMYPTVVRTIAIGFASLSTRMGGVLAPFIIPQRKENLYVLITIVVIANAICSVISLKLPETKNKLLKETFEETKEDRNVVVKTVIE